MHTSKHEIFPPKHVQELQVHRQKVKGSLVLPPRAVTTSVHPSLFYLTSTDKPFILLVQMVQHLVPGPGYALAFSLDWQQVVTS